MKTLTILLVSAFICCLVVKVERRDKVRENALKQAREEKIKALNRYTQLLEHEINR